VGRAAGGTASVKSGCHGVQRCTHEIGSSQVCDGPGVL
jgi:hypothetical protein